MKKHYVVIAENGGPQHHPLKDWFRATQGMPEATQWTSHQMRGYLKKRGWTINETSNEVHVIEPNSKDLEGMANEEEVVSSTTPEAEPSAQSSLFALESHLREYLVRNLNSTIKVSSPLEIVGVEYSTEVGFIDLLAKNNAGDLYVFELKLERGVDAAMGQLLRYMGWCSRHLAGKGRTVFGIILAAEISEKLRYAATQVPNVTLLEYELQIKVRPAPAI
jgi:RecB family endonuclease NucS